MRVRTTGGRPGAGWSVALVASSYLPHIGGVEQHTAQVARELRARGRRVEVWTVARDGTGTVRSVDGITVRYLPTPLPSASPGGITRFLMNAPVAARHWVAAYRTLRPDLLHVHCFGPNGVYAVVVGCLTRTPMLVSSHGETLADDHNAFAQSMVLRGSLRAAIRMGATLTAVATEVADDLRRRFGAGEVSIVSNGVRGPVRARAPRQRRSRVLAAGRLELNKGFDLLIRAMPHLPDADLRIIGDGSQALRLRDLAVELDVADRVHLLGPTGPAQVMEDMAEADVVVVPSRKEAFGIVVLEAWASGTPVVATSVAGPATFVRDGVDGLLVDPHDDEALADAVGRLLTDDVLWSRLSDEAARSVRSYTWSDVVRRYETLYDEAVPLRFAVGRRPGRVPGGSA